jgi:hypothetical protein
MLIIHPMSWKKGDLLRAFNYASVPLYGLGKGAAWLSDQGYHIYSIMPDANRFIRHHFASFWGAYAFAYLAGEALLYAAEKLPRTFGKVAKHSTELSTAFSAAVLTGWELTTGFRNKFDWGDMAIYGAAMGLYYFLNRSHKDKTPAPAKTDAGAKELPNPNVT